MLSDLTIQVFHLLMSTCRRFLAVLRMNELVQYYLCPCIPSFYLPRWLLLPSPTIAFIIAHSGWCHTPYAYRYRVAQEENRFWGTFTLSPTIQIGTETRILHRVYLVRHSKSKSQRVVMVHQFLPTLFALFLYETISCDKGRRPSLR